MPHSYSRILYHAVFATKSRERRIDDDLKRPLYEYIGGIVRTLGGTLFEINGMPDHVHLLLHLKPQTPITTALHQIKGSSSRWIHTSFGNGQRGSFWQNGYGAFSVSESQVPAVARYIRYQEEHHRRYSFDEELKVLLKRHRVETAGVRGQARPEAKPDRRPDSQPISEPRVETLG